MIGRESNHFVEVRNRLFQAALVFANTSAVQKCYVIRGIDARGFSKQFDRRRTIPFFEGGISFLDQRLTLGRRGKKSSLNAQGECHHTTNHNAAAHVDSLYHIFSSCREQKKKRRAFRRS